MSSLLTLAADRKKSTYDLTNKFRMVKVCNLPAAASKYQICTLFAFFGETDLAIIYPTDDNLLVENKIAFLRFIDPDHAAGAMHLTNTVYLDKTLIVTPVPDEKIPDEETVLGESLHWTVAPTIANLSLPTSTQKAPVKFYVGFAHVPPEPKYDPDLPPLKLSELQRTIYIHNIHQQVSAEALLTLFSGIGEVKHVKLATYPDSDFKYGLIEFTDVSCIPLALQYHDFPLCGVCIKTDYSMITIDKKDLNRRNRNTLISHQGLERSDSPQYFSRVTAASTSFRRDSSPEWTRSRFKDDDRSPPTSSRKYNHEDSNEKKHSPRRKSSHSRDRKRSKHRSSRDDKSPKSKKSKRRSSGRRS